MIASTQTAHSHLPVLAEILDAHDIRTVFEFGMGDGSTGLFLEKCLLVVSVEMNKVEWFKKLTQRWGHKTNWTPVLRLGMDTSWTGTMRYDMAFIDGHGDCRPEQIRTAMQMTDLIVVHDTQEPGYRWERIKDDLPDGWTWEDDKRHPTWTSVLRREEHGVYAADITRDSICEPPWVREYIAATGCKVEIRQKTNLRQLFIGITNFCNLKCTTCNRFIDSAPSDDMMSLEQITRFVDESIALNWPWNDISVYGGEPTIHPDYLAILDEILRLKQHVPGMRIKIVTNGKGRRVNAAIAKTPKQFGVHRSTADKDTAQNIGGKSVIPEFGNVLQAPCDRIKGTITDCQIHATCGLELTPYGFLPCPCGGARVLGLDVFFKRLSDVTMEECKKRLEAICGICGRNLNYEIKCKETIEASPFWERALAEYAKSPPKLERY